MGVKSLLGFNQGTNSDSGKENDLASFEGINEFDVDSSSLLHNSLAECRVTKTDMEVELMRYANRITSEAHVKLMQVRKSLC